MAKYLRPRRGSETNARSQNIKLQKGELFMEFPNGYIGKEPGRIVVGCDGTTTYSALNHSSVAQPALNTYQPFITDPSIYIPKFTNTATSTGSGSVTSAMSEINNIGDGSTTSTKTLPNIIGSIKKSLIYHDNSITELNSELINTFNTLNDGKVNRSGDTIGDTTNGNFVQIYDGQSPLFPAYQSGYIKVLHENSSYIAMDAFDIYNKNGWDSDNGTTSKKYLTAILASKANSSTLSNYAPASTLSNYAPASTLSNYSPTSHTHKYLNAPYGKAETSGAGNISSGAWIGALSYTFTKGLYLVSYLGIFPSGGSAKVVRVVISATNANSNMFNNDCLASGVYNNTHEIRVARCVPLNIEDSSKKLYLNLNAEGGNITGASGRWHIIKLSDKPGTY